VEANEHRSHVEADLASRLQDEQNSQYLGGFNATSVLVRHVYYGIDEVDEDAHVVAQGPVAGCEAPGNGAMVAEFECC
jgi:hypothetical protein